jgi:hypothetical protein
MLVLFYNSFGGEDDYYDRWQAPFVVDGEAGEQPVSFIHDRARLREADVVVFHLPTLRIRDLDEARKWPGQRWVAWSMEHGERFARQGDADFMAHFDVTMTYERRSDVWVPYLPHDADELLASPVAKSTDAPAVLLLSAHADTCDRLEYLGELMQHLPVDSYGRMLNNRSLPDGVGGRDTWDWRADKQKLIATYPFTLAFENALLDDYVTEKFFDPLRAGSVPVYRGAPNIAEFAPSPDCYVDVRDFDSPGDLAAHLAAVAADPVAYERFHAWRAGGVTPEFAAMVELTAENPMVRLARFLGSQPAPPRKGRSVRPFRRPLVPRVTRRLRRLAGS